MIDEKKLIEEMQAKKDELTFNDEFYGGFAFAMELVKAQPQIDTLGQWIPVSVRMPNVETNVYICAKRKLRGGECRYIYTVAMYEDGTVLENDSTWNWEELDGEWNETEECYIIPEGWWESTQYHPEGVLNSPVSDEVIAWMPLPEDYKGE